MVTLTKENFKQEVLDCTKPVIVDFWATWCGPCRMIAPELEKLENTLGDKIKLGKVNVDEQLQLATDYNIEVIPNVILFENGKPVKKAEGYFSAEELNKKFFG